MFKVMYGSIVNEEHTYMINNLVIIVDKSCGCVLKYGDAKMSNIKEWYATAVERFRAIDPDLADNIIMIEFDRYSEVLNIEDICTILNYAVNCHSIELMKIFEMDADSLKVRLEQLRNYGY